jgi:hypothetical protein
MIPAMIIVINNEGDRHPLADLRQAEPGGDLWRPAKVRRASRPGLVTR